MVAAALHGKAAALMQSSAIRSPSGIQSNLRLEWASMPGFASAWQLNTGAQIDAGASLHCCE